MTNKAILFSLIMYSCGITADTSRLDSLIPLITARRVSLYRLDIDSIELTTSGLAQLMAIPTFGHPADHQLWVTMMCERASLPVLLGDCNGRSLPDVALGLHKKSFFITWCREVHQRLRLADDSQYQLIDDKLGAIENMLHDKWHVSQPKKHGCFGRAFDFLCSFVKTSYTQ